MGGSFRLHFLSSLTPPPNRPTTAVLRSQTFGDSVQCGAVRIDRLGSKEEVLSSATQIFAVSFDGLVMPAPEEC